MKKIVVGIIIVTLFFSLLSIISGESSNILTEREKNLAENIARNFHMCVKSVDEIDPNDIGWYVLSFIQQECLDLYQSDGYIHIPTYLFETYCWEMFGVRDIKFNNNLPYYDEEADIYLFMPLGEGANAEAVVKSMSFLGNSNYIEMLIDITIIPWSSEDEVENYQYVYVFERMETEKIPLRLVQINYPDAP